MRGSDKSDGLSLQVIAGTHSVIFGIDLIEEHCKGLLGFAIHRNDHTGDEAYCLDGQKRFKWADEKRLEGREVSRTSLSVATI